ncbi:thiamine pyrophosphate-requiring protein [Candidatus Poribacteria bacterium]|jgi:thiamine pyrophosphate-dependent acetolactate synthase large subunit-like protein|nr:thiamine pyrophosphate-requiring protein [Candidatus Poribacteria bacterium]MBT5531772.1 thiamine pyrophosphate-requiring protein [Candidatus Poribacteria bacterium]MBT5713833.1 thiamine pyrophosphate-requiring protein [Candidatus Poribacteria bacterium]MBT7098876.1 thiamine pyrophosphate-requiring protein [Candidatus Poribacteria bacterium]MBT7804518.1 thiamine pyrophosphate-requiring protein [Candidatus Poribacteria bacterium]
MNGDQAVVEVLKREGTEWIAAFPYQGLIEQAVRAGIRPIICRQERVGVNMADGFSRISNGRRIGVFTMQSGPGAENAYAGVAQAFADSVPILVLPGGPGATSTQIHPVFEAPKHYAGVTKWAGSINVPSRLPSLMRYAYTQLRHGRPGPVLLEIPGDVARQDQPGDTLEYTPPKTYRSEADAGDVRDIVSTLLSASRPVLCAGQGVLMAEATDELTELAELTDTPMMATMAGKSAFSEEHPLSLGAGGRSGTLMVAHFMRAADFILGVGTSFTRSGFTVPMPAGTPLGQITNCPEDINKDQRVEHVALGDAKLVLRQVIDEVKRRHESGKTRDAGRYTDELDAVRSEFMAEWGPRLTSDETPMSPYRVFHELASVVDVGNAIVTHDAGYPRDQLVPMWRPTTPRGYIGWGKSTQLGYGLGLAMGAKLAAPERHVINVMGDAAFGMTGLDIETAVRSRIGITTIVLNNGVMTGYDQHMPEATAHWDSNELAGDYADIGAALGAHAQRVETPDELAGAFRAAFAANAEGRPAVVEAMTKAEKAVSLHW